MDDIGNDDDSTYTRSRFLCPSLPNLLTLKSKLDRKSNKSRKGKKESSSESFYELTEVRWFDGNIGDDRVEELALDLIENPKYEHVNALNLSKNRIGDAGFIALAGALPKLDNLRQILLGDNPFVTSTGMSAMGKALQNGAKIQALNLTKCFIGTQECIALSSGLTGNKYLKELLLHSNLIGNEGIKQLGMSISRNSALEVLDVSDNPIGEDGLISLVGSLSCNQKLRKLYLNDTSTSILGMRFMADLLATNASLTALITRRHPRGSTRHLATTPELETLERKTEFYLKLNASGRLYLRQQPSRAILPLVYSRVSNDKSLLYGLLLEVPHLIQRT